ncbi:MAG: DUF6527 family protein [Bacteroidota bacterium]|nr:DUF6527 family protein [Bacteroidota bacterium]
MELRHEFVDYIPKQLDDNVLYVSFRFGTVVHRCACGCGEEVVTPLGPAEWELTYDGDSVSLAPSIGNWSFPCRSHYWVEKGSVRWARVFSETEVISVRKEAKTRRDGYYQKGPDALIEELPRRIVRCNLKKPIWQMLRSLVRWGGG